MVKLIVLDVDGVIVGHKPGINFPYPSKPVIEAVKQVREQGIPVVLCSGKFHHAIEPIIFQANLDNPHITDSGALLIDPITKQDTRAFSIDSNVVINIINTCNENKIYVEAYSENNYFIQKENNHQDMPKRIAILQKDPVIVDSLADEAKKQKIIKFILVAFNDDEKKKIESLFKQYTNQVKLVWSANPGTPGWHYYIVTSKNASKAIALTTLAKSLGISLEDTLGVGDTLGDWEFMNLCGYVATMNDASDELKELVGSKKKHLVAPSVDEDGILQILDHFLR